MVKEKQIEKCEEESEKKRTKPRFPDPSIWRKPKPDTPENTEDHYKPPAPGKWQDVIKDWYRKRKKERQEQTGKEPPRTHIPIPRLNCTSNFIPYILSGSDNVSFSVWNEGDFPAWTCYVEVYEGPSGYSHSLSDYEFKGRKIITLFPGQRRDVELNWNRSLETGRIVGIVYDPILDHIDFELVEQYNRHITSVHWTNLAV